MHLIIVKLPASFAAAVAAPALSLGCCACVSVVGCCLVIQSVYIIYMLRHTPTSSVAIRPDSAAGLNTSTK